MEPTEARGEQVSLQKQKHIAKNVHAMYYRCGGGALFLLRKKKHAARANDVSLSLSLLADEF